MTELSPTEREALEVFQEQQWTPVPIPPIGERDDWYEWPFTPCGILPVAPEDLEIGCKVNDAEYYARMMGCGFQLTSVQAMPTDDGQWNVHMVFSPIPPQ